MSSSLTNSPTISVSTISDVYHTLIEKGCDRDALQKETGISLADIEDLDARVPISCLQKIWKIALEETNDPAIGLKVGEKIDPGRFSVVAQASFQCDTVRDVLNMYARFFSIVNESASLKVVEQGDKATIEFHCPSSEYYCISEMERMMATSLARFSYLVGKKIRAYAFKFEHEQPEYIEEYKKVFDAPLSFSQVTCAVVVGRGLLDLKVKHGNPYLLNVLSGYAEKLLQKLSTGTDTQSKVREFIKRHLADDASLDVKRAANELNMSRHTLYRKLKKEGLSFQALVEDVRQGEAKDLLSQNEVSISEVAFLLGFSELSAFSRAFKRWTGESPAQYRARI